MTTSAFSQLKTNMSDITKLTDQLAKAVGGKQNNNDDKFWTITRDKAGNGTAIIRFLPAPPNEDIPFVRIWSHGIQIGRASCRERV